MWSFLEHAVPISVGVALVWATWRENRKPGAALEDAQRRLEAMRAARRGDCWSGDR